jgi:SAM-dependent methyltransferase
VTQFALPDDAHFYILLQRTAYQRPLNRYFRRIRRLGAFYDKYLIRFAESSRKDEISKLYAEDMQCEFDTFEQFLPIGAKSLLDIGCGIGGIDAVLYRHYSDCEPVLSLLDKDGVSGSLYYGYRQTGAFYNSLAIAEEFLAANAVPRSNIVTYDVNEDGFPNDETFDVILSLISWGFHYPIETYLNEAHAALSDSGVLILDVRKGTDGKEILSQRFSSIEVIQDGEKSERVLVKK